MGLRGRWGWHPCEVRELLREQCRKRRQWWHKDRPIRGDGNVNFGDKGTGVRGVVGEKLKQLDRLGLNRQMGLKEP